MNHSNDVIPHAIFRCRTPAVRHFDEMEVHRLLTDNPGAYRDHVNTELALIARGDVRIELPAKQVFIDADMQGDFRVMPCILRSNKSARKIVKLVGTDIIQALLPDQITVGMAFVLHPEENFVSHSFAACLLSSARTGMCAALAAERLMDKYRRIAVIGAGRVGYYSALYLGQFADTGEIVLIDRDTGKAEQVACLLQTRHGLPAVAMKKLPNHDVDVLVLATDSRETIIRPDVGAQTIISLGADTLWQHELDAGFADGRKIYVDTMDSLNYGDLKAWIDTGKAGTDDIMPLFLPDACVGKNREPAPGQKLFISTGSALLDNLTIGYILKQTEGTIFP